MQMRKGFNRKSYLNLCLLAAKLYGQQLGNAFKSIDKMKCNPLVVASLLPFLAAFLCCHCNCIHVFTDCTEFCINFNATLDQTDRNLPLLPHSMLHLPIPVATKVQTPLDQTNFWSPIRWRKYFQHVKSCFGPK